jgi:hypothetical protein
VLELIMNRNRPEGTIGDDHRNKGSVETQNSWNKHPRATVEETSAEQVNTRSVPSHSDSSEVRSCWNDVSFTVKLVLCSHFYKSGDIFLSCKHFSATYFVSTFREVK